MKTISIVAPNGARIADGIKTLEVRSWIPNLNPDEELLVVENNRYLKVEGDVDPDGYAVAIVKVAKVRTFEKDDILAACATSFAEGYYSWELINVRKIPNPIPVPAKRGLYETDFCANEFNIPVLDSHYVNPKLAQLYDLDSGWSIEREFYLSLAGESRKCVLDLGCGTGLICDALAAKGHEVVGVDPSAAMLEIARQKPNGSKVEWVLSTAQNFKSNKNFDLIIMTGNAFQVLLEEADLRAVCKVINTHLKPDGLIAFESRNPNLDWAARWNYEIKLNTPIGEVIESRNFLKWTDNRMFFELRYQLPDEKLTSRSQLRFWSPNEIKELLSEAGLRIERLMGDWEFGDFKEDSTEEMVFIARHHEIKFVAVEEEHIPVLRKWLKEPHVAEFWQETDNEEKFREKFLSKLQNRGVSPFIIYIGRKPVGYIQSYEAQKVGGGWWPDAEPGTFGIDQFIGEPGFIDKGWGTKIIKQFVEDLFQSPSVKEVITDPEPKNARAIRAYEKVGFIRVGEIETPGGDALLMKMSRVSEMASDLRLVIREANENDVPGIRKVIRSSIEGLAAKDYSNEIIQSWGADTPKAQAKQRLAVREGKELTWVALQNDKIIGFSAFSPQTQELRAVYVASEVARLGVGTKLLACVEIKARELGLSELRMHSSITASPFYKRLGYSVVGEIIHTLSTGAKMTAIEMKKDLSK